MNSKLIGERIRAAREAAELTQEQLGKAVGCTTRHIGVIERGLKTPKLSTFVHIANTIGAPADLLLQDVLESPVDSLACEFAAAVSPLPRDVQVKILKSLRAFSKDWEK